MGFADDVALAHAPNESQSPHVLEVELVAKETTLEVLSGKPTPVYAYNGTVPGPLLELTAGDRLKVHFKNELPEPTSIHWHGVRVPAEMDGVPDYSQAPVPPGGTFDYDFVVPDAGLFWYHPHVASAKQVGYGLYGPLLVRPNDGSEASAPPDEVVLVLSDIGIKQIDGSITDPTSGGDLGTLFGRQGNFTLVNGKPNPTLNVRSGVPMRWRIVNAAKSRYFQLSLDGTRFKRIGSDGGLNASPTDEDKLLLTPGERADVIVTPHDAPGSLVFLRSEPYDRGFGTSDFMYPSLLMGLDFVGEDPAPSGAPAAAPRRAIEPLDPTNATQVNVKLTQMTDAKGDVVLGINGVPFASAPPFPAFIGDTQIWTIENTMHWDHPFHMHGFFFQVLGDDGLPEQPLAWHDTINIPTPSSAGGPGGQPESGRRRIIVRFDERPGMWMFHCHILDHAEAGMMGMIDLRRP